MNRSDTAEHQLPIRERLEHGDGRVAGSAVTSHIHVRLPRTNRDVVTMRGMPRIVR